ncbi:MAG TPA: dihydrolipoyl dehydrogenase [Planctomycetota bacterium]|nr:dihydrolipoyl dehydrogenase [Planctomycetota bacterium]
MARSFDAVVLGSGPGGYVAAIRLGQLGKKTLVVEKNPTFGGVCLNWGCIPSKAVIHAAELRQEAARSAAFGIGTGALPALDLPKLQAWKREIVKKLTGGIGTLLKANGVETVKGRGRLLGPNRVHVEGDQKEEIEAKAIILATGARPIELPFLKGSRVWTSKEFLELDEIPRRVAIVGGGIIGLELGCALLKLGTEELSIVEMLPDILPGTDPDLVRPVRRKLKETKGVSIHVEAKASGYGETATEARLEIETKEGKKEIVCDRVLSAIGFRPNSEDLGLADAGVATDKRGHVLVDQRCRTNVPSIYAIGDLTGAPYLAHRASKQGLVAAEVIAGEPSAFDVQAMPAAIFSDPEIATVGLSEADARAKGKDVAIGKFPFSVLGRALAQDATEGLVKVVSDKKSGLLLGVGIVGARASDLIAEATLAIEMGARAEDLALTVHAHPTFPEALMEATEDALGHAIHIATKKR